MTESTVAPAFHYVHRSASDGPDGRRKKRVLPADGIAPRAEVAVDGDGGHRHEEGGRPRPEGRLRLHRRPLGLVRGEVAAHRHRVVLQAADGVVDEVLGGNSMDSKSIEFSNITNDSYI